MLSPGELDRAQRVMPLSFKRVGEDVVVSLTDPSIGIKVRATIGPDDSVTVATLIITAFEKEVVRLKANGGLMAADQPVVREGATFVANGSATAASEEYRAPVKAVGWLSEELPATRTTEVHVEFEVE